MPFVKTPIQNNSDRQKKDDFQFPLRAVSGIQSLASSIQHSPRSQNSSPYENSALFPLRKLQTHTLPMTPMPRPPPELPTPIHDSQPSNSKSPPNLHSATDKGKIAHFAIKLKEKYKIIDANSSLRKPERK